MHHLDVGSYSLPQNEFDEWHKCICLFGNYSRCGVAILPLCPNEVTKYNFVMVQWRCFALETTMLKASKALEKLTLVYKTMSIYEFIDHMKPKLQHFVGKNTLRCHNFSKLKSLFKVLF
jgi:hypothetical protein